MALLHMEEPTIMNLKKIRRLMKKYGLVCPIRRANPYRIALRENLLENTVRLVFIHCQKITIKTEELTKNVTVEHENATYETA